MDLEIQAARAAAAAERAATDCRTQCRRYVGIARGPAEAARDRASLHAADARRYARQIDQGTRERRNADAHAFQAAEAARDASQWVKEFFP